MKKEELEVILTSTNDAVMAINSQEKITVFNRAAEEITGLSEKEAIGASVEDVILNTRLPYVLQTGEAELNQKQFLGETTIITSRMPVKDEKGNVIGAVAVFRDISEMIDLTHQIYKLKEMQSLLEGIFHSTQDAISVCDENGLGVLINPAYTRVTGFTEKDIIGKPVTTDISEGESVHLEVLNTKRPVKNRRLKLGPQKKEALVHAAPIIVDGELRGSVGIIHDLTEIKNLTDELMAAKQIIRKLEAKYIFDDIIAVDHGMIQVMEKAKQAAVTPATVLLRGESGTGKELFAHAIHNLSERRYNQFVRVNCAAISESLLESELFGYVEGAFTGAAKGGKRGLFEEAHRGTIFLDEIAEIPLNTQAKLLRVLQEKEITRVGSTETVGVDVRVIAATNVSLEKAVREGKFREDLYYRLNVIPIEIPPLRERKKDLYPLVLYLIKKFNQEYGRNVEEISQEALDKLMSYNWPGNVRELENFIGRTFINMNYTDKIILERNLPKIIDRVQGDRDGGKNLARVVDINYSESRGLRETLEEVERRYIKEVLEKYHGNRTRAAKELKISLRNLYYKIEKYNL